MYIESIIERRLRYLPTLGADVSGATLSFSKQWEHCVLAVNSCFASPSPSYSSLVQVCDADMRILAVDPRFPGATHDAFVWRRSWVRQECLAGRLLRQGEYLLGECLKSTLVCNCFSQWQHNCFKAGSNQDLLSQSPKSRGRSRRHRLSTSMKSWKYISLYSNM